VPDILVYLDKLASLAHPDGGWGYAPGQSAHLEPTCLALLALALEPQRHAAAIDRGKELLRRCAGPDGVYRLAHGREEAAWPTALVLFVQCALGYPAAECRRTAATLLSLAGKPAHSKEASEIQDIDVGLVGWPWAEGNFSWAEPTAWACLALRRAGHGKHPRVEEGLRLLLDRAADEGGINYGNRRVLGRLTEPIPGPTALMLLALQGHDDQPRVVAAAAYLLKQALTTDDLEHLCWARLALAEHRSLPGVEEGLAALEERILAAHQARAGTAYLRESPPRQALTALALAVPSPALRACEDGPSLALRANAGGGTPFHVNGTAAAEDLPAVRARQPHKPLSEKFRSLLRGMAVRAMTGLRQPPERSRVHIARAESYADDLAGVVGKQYESFRQAVPLAGKRVVLKPNLVEYHRDKVINTNPQVVAAVIELCRREGAAEVIVAEGPGHWRNVEYLVAASGLGDVLKRYNVPFIDLNHDEPVKTPNMGRLTKLDFLYLSRTVATAEVLISLPKLKTHHWAGATLSLKNLFGILPGICYGWPKNELHWRGIENSIVDIALTRTPNLALVDGIVGMEGDGPLNGTAKQVGALVMGTDLVAVDATCCRLMGLDPEKVGHLQLAARMKLGLLRPEQIEQVGEAVASLAQAFETVPHFRQLCLAAGR
jgi:uncharacterized protein (DUF362 family)